MAEIEIQEAKEIHLEKIREIWNHEILNSTSIFEEKPIDLIEVTSWYKNRKSNGFPIFVALYNQQVVAYASYGPFREKSGYQITVEHSIYVDPNHRGNGSGRLLMRKLLQSAKEQGFKNVIAVIDASNYKSIRFHEKFGFIESGRLERIARKFDSYLDAVILQHSIYR